MIQPLILNISIFSCASGREGVGYKITPFKVVENTHWWAIKLKWVEGEKKENEDPKSDEEKEKAQKSVDLLTKQLETFAIAENSKV